MLLAVDLYEHFIDVEGVAITLMSPFQPPGISGVDPDITAVGPVVASEAKSVRFYMNFGRPPTRCVELL